MTDQTIPVITIAPQPQPVRDEDAERLAVDAAAGALLHAMGMAVRAGPYDGKQGPYWRLNMTKAEFERLVREIHTLRGKLL